MIDIEIQVFNIVRNAIISKYPDAFISSENIRQLTKFPSVQILELDNSTYTKSFVNGKENHCKVLYQIDVYCNGNDKKEICRDITNLIDSELVKYGFTRKMSGGMANVEDANIYRHVSTYTGIVGRDNYIYLK